MPKRDVRYQAAIIHDDHVLMLRVWDYGASGETFWLIPGGGRIPGESEEDCVQREVREETHLEIEVGRLLLEEPDIPGGTYERTKTYLCTIRSGIAKPGVEDFASITAVGWFDLRDATNWDALAVNNPITLVRLHGLQSVLGYAAQA